MTEDNKFAHLHTYSDIGQVVVIQQQADETGNPEIRIFLAPKGLGVCSMAISWSDDSDESWDKADLALSNAADPMYARNLIEKSGVLDIAKEIEENQDDH